MIFGKKKFKRADESGKKDIPQGLWTKCPECGDVIFNKKFLESNKVCGKCNYHFTLTAEERINLLADYGTFEEFDREMTNQDPLGFKGPKTYVDKAKSDKKKTGLNSAVMTGTCQLDGYRVALGVTDSNYIMGSMGSVEGEKISRLIEYATDQNIPVIVISGSGGGARMYEGMFSLMQMSKTSAALARHHKKGGFFVSVLTNPTMAGVMASFASLGDVIIAEPKALIGFTGPRVIEQTIRQKLPEGFQKSEFLLEHGLIDKIVHRSEMKSFLRSVISYV